MFAAVWRHGAATATAGQAARTGGTAGEVASLALEYSSGVERIGECGAVFDASGLERPFGGAWALARHVAGAAAGRGWRCGVALACSRTAALVLARAAIGPVAVPPGREARSLADLPVALVAWVDALDGQATPTPVPVGEASPGARPAQETAVSGGQARSTRHPSTSGATRHYRMAPAPLSAWRATAGPRVAGGAGDVSGAGRTDHTRTPEHPGFAPGLPAVVTSAGEPLVLPVDAADLLDTLARWGVRTVGDLAALPRAGLHARLGERGVRWHRLAHGEDLRPLVRHACEEPWEQTLAFDWPIEGLEPLSFALARVIEPLVDRLARGDRGAVGIRVWLRLVTRTIHARYLQLPAPLRDARTLRTLVLLDLESAPPPAGIDAVTVAFDVAPGRAVQHSLLTRPVPSPDDLATLLARLTALMGEGRCGQPVIVDTHRPGAFAMAPFAPADVPTGADKGQHGAVRRRAPRVPAPRDRDAMPSRPPVPQRRGGPRLADEGQRHDAQGEPAAVLRRFRRPVPARVVLDGSGRPVRVAARRIQMADGSPVLERAGPWRTSGGWWQAPARGNAAHGPWDREEWDVALGQRGVYRISRDVSTGAWVVEGYWD